jgi:branched-chain amino acid transport system substrate-binding protein
MMDCIKFPKKTVLLFVSLFLIVIACSSCAKKSNLTNEENFDTEDTLEVQTIDGDEYIAIAVPLTGPYRDLGNSIVEGATLAVEEFNENSKQRIGTIIIDDGGLASEGLARADIVIAQKALGVIGHLNSEISIEAAKKYAKAGIPAISPASTHPKLTEIAELKGFIYRTIGTDKQLGDIAAQIVSKDTSIKKVAVLYNDRPYGVSVASEFTKKLNELKTHELVLNQTIPVRTSNHKDTAQKVIQSGSELVFFVGEYNDAAYLLSSLKALNPKIKFIGSEGIFHDKFITLAGASSDGALVIGSGYISPELEKNYQKRFSKASSGYVSTSYKATKILLEAIQKNNFKNPAGIAKYLSTNPVFDSKGDLAKPDFTIYQVQGSKFIPKTQS